MLTHERLSRALRSAGEPALARRASKLEFDALHHLSTAPQLKLVRVLRATLVTNRRVAPVLLAAQRGEYYNTDAEVNADRARRNRT